MTVHRYIKEPFKMYNLECVLSVHVLLNEFKPLRLMMFNDVFVKLVEGPFFIDLAYKREIKAGMCFDELKSYLQKQNYPIESIDKIWDLLCQYTILSILSIQYEFDLYKVELKTYQIL